MRNVLNWLTAILFTLACHDLTSQALADEATVIGYELHWDISDAYKPGQKVESDAILEIARCGTLVLRTEGGLVELNGPYKGTFKAYTRQFACVGGTPAERITAYDYYFGSICERKGTCDAICSQVFRRVTHKDGMTLKCP